MLLPEVRPICESVAPQTSASRTSPRIGKEELVYADYLACRGAATRRSSHARGAADGERFPTLEPNDRSRVPLLQYVTTRSVANAPSPDQTVATVSADAPEIRARNSIIVFRYARIVPTGRHRRHFTSPSGLGTQPVCCTVYTIAAIFHPSAVRMSENESVPQCENLPSR